MPERPWLGTLLLRDRVLLIGGLAAVTLVTWLYTIDMAAGHGSHGGHGFVEHSLHETGAVDSAVPYHHAARGAHVHSAHDGHDGHDKHQSLTVGLARASRPHAEHLGVLSLIVMWIVMMVAMMLPSAGPVALLHAKFVRSKGSGEPAVMTGMFLLGYVFVWSVFSAGAALAQIVLERADLMSSLAMALFSSTAGGIALILAGAFQFSPWKDACLHQCRTPLGFLMTEWRDGRRGAFVMGIRNGAFCLGCCWAIMLLLFVGGVMSMLWMAGLTALMLLEKLAPYGRYIGRAAGVGLVAGGCVMLVA